MEMISEKCKKIVEKFLSSSPSLNMSNWQQMNIEGKELGWVSFASGDYWFEFKIDEESNSFTMSEVFFGEDIVKLKGLDLEDETIQTIMNYYRHEEDSWESKKENE